MPKNSAEPPDLPRGACTWLKTTLPEWQEVETVQPVRRFEAARPPSYVWSEKDAAFIFDGKIVPNEASREAVDNLVDYAIARSVVLTEKLAKDDDVDGWFLALLALLSATALAAGGIAAGGRARVVGAIKDAIDRAIQYQTDFLRRWAGTMADQVRAGGPAIRPETTPDEPGGAGEGNQPPEDPAAEPAGTTGEDDGTGVGVVTGGGVLGGGPVIPGEPPTLGESIARAGMYVTAAVGVYEAIRRTVLRNDGRIRWERRIRNAANSCTSCRVYANAGWVRLGTLPGIGQACECHSNCRCMFDYSDSIVRPS